MVESRSNLILFNDLNKIPRFWNQNYFNPQKTAEFSKFSSKSAFQLLDAGEKKKFREEREILEKKKILRENRNIKRE